MKHRILALMAVTLMLTGCGKSSEPELTPEELEHNALVEWFESGIKDEEKFTDLGDYRYYARTIGLDKDGLIDPEIWEIFWNEDININKEIDGKSIYLIRLDPYKLMEVWSENNEMTADKICSALGTTPDKLYYNFGYTSNSIDYAKNHKNGKVSYADIENEIFGEDNGENRSIVFGTHFLYIDTANKYKVTYSGEDENLAVKQRDILKATTDESHNYSEYTYDEFHSQTFRDGVEINRVMKLNIPNLWGKSIEEEIDLDASVMFNMSPYSYGCSIEDIVTIYAENTEENVETEITIESEVSE